MIGIQNLAYLVSDKLILNKINAKIIKGDKVAVLGKIGSGKSTLLKLIMGLIKPSSGEISIENRKVSHMKPREIALEVAYVPQNLSGGIMDCSLREFVAMGRYPYFSPFHGPSLEDWENVDLWLKQYDLSHLAHQEINSLSGGEFRTALLLSAFAQGAKTLLLDEPTSNLDPGGILHLAEQLREQENWAEQTLLMVSHDLNLINALCDRVIAMKDGSILFDESIAVLNDPKFLHKTYEVDFKNISFSKWNFHEALS